MPRVTVIDYGIGNILSVMRAFEYCGADVTLTGKPGEVENADFLVLPGVGAFADGMRGLRDRELIEPVKRFAERDRPFMGICLGMQMMLEESEEFGLHKGLGLIPGRVVEIEKTDIGGRPHKIPHIGWNELVLPEGREETWWRETILSGAKVNDTAYFVHSFTAIPAREENRLADAFYGGRLISAAIRKGNIYGCQFHPEKSGKTGIEIIRNFLKL